MKRIRDGRCCLYCAKSIGVRWGTKSIRPKQGAYFEVKYPDKSKLGNPKTWRFFRAHDECQPKFLCISQYVHTYVSKIGRIEFGDTNKLSKSKSLLIDICKKVCNDYMGNVPFINPRMITDKDTGQDTGVVREAGVYLISESFFNTQCVPMLKVALAAIICIYDGRGNEIVIVSE